MPVQTKRFAHMFGLCNRRLWAGPPLFAAVALTAAQDVKPPPAAVTSLKTEDLAEFHSQSPEVQALLRQALALTEKNLTYTFASADPKNGGMDCSGTIYYLLRQTGHNDVPRQSNVICQWIIDNGSWHRTENVTSLEDAAFDALRPGDLLFWSGTYEHSDRALPVSHVMLYLGHHQHSGKRLVFGASDGRRYQGERRCGVSVFDFTLPKEGSPSAFYGYGSLPGRQPLLPTPVSPPPRSPTTVPTEEIRKPRPVTPSNSAESP